MGRTASQPYLVDPLAFAVEQAWKAGIFVVTATGNAGYAFKTGTLTNPAFDPKIFAVGASDSMGTRHAGDDIGGQPSRPPAATARTPDVVAPARTSSASACRDRTSTRTTARPASSAQTLFRGSGTSEAAAFVSGAAALVIQQHPAITPAALKRLFLAQRDRPRIFEPEAGIRRG